ncbi:hemin-degrading factor [Donghicola sp. XS_ASV15]|uniref:hemin-degrading factor n=1 Tax=Donghicola sp. XS_ASV15 TaxID=3241295 RepID=UPI00351171DE
MTKPDPSAIRAARAETPNARDRDFAESLGISEAELVAAHVGHGVTRISANPDDLMPQISRLGEVMALTRNASAVHERVGTYGEYRAGPHASMVLGDEIDLRIFPRHWVYGFAIDQETDKGRRRSLQVFDAAGDAVHKVFLRETSELSEWIDVVGSLMIDDPAQTLDVAERAPVEPAKTNPAKSDILLDEWAKLTDTHQFLRLTSKLGMNRLGAYRMASGGRWVRPLAIDATDRLIETVSAAGAETILFVGNQGNIQIHWGGLETVKAMGPWMNVLDPRFNLHLRSDHVAEVYAIEKPTKRGPAISVEAFDAEGALILQVFGRKTDSDPHGQKWAELVSALPTLSEVAQCAV